MTLPSTMPSPTKTLSERSDATITALSALFTTTPSHPPTLPAHLPLWAALETAYATALSTFSLPEDAARPLSRAAPPVINAVFDTDASLLFRAFGPSLTPEDRALLLAQGVAGLALFFRGLGEAAAAAGGRGEGVVSADLLARELEDFRTGEERPAALGAVEGSDAWPGCAARGEVAAVVSAAVGRAADGVGPGVMVEGGSGGAARGGWEEEGTLWGGEVVGRPRNMGLPWGFSILPVN